MQPKALTALSFHRVFKRHSSAAFFSCGVSPPRLDMMYNGLRCHRAETRPRKMRIFTVFQSPPQPPLCAFPMVNTIVSLVVDGLEVLWGNS